MSSSKQASVEDAANGSDQDMMEAPDSPPEQNLFSPTFTPQTQSSQQAANLARANGESNVKVNFGAPGSSYQTKKFMEEYERAENQLLDRQWDATKYGDPLIQGP